MCSSDSSSQKSATRTREPDREIKEGAVRIEGEVVRRSHISMNGSGNGSERLTLRVGKRAKVAVIESS